MIKKTIKIGTRDSLLAIWQAEFVKQKIEGLGYETELVPVKSSGDIELATPLYEMGSVGVFTKTLDIALLENRVDIAVHSMKDVPTQLPKGIKEFAVMKRGSYQDVLLYKDNLSNFKEELTIATGSLRRKAQWLHQYPHHKVEDIRGNVLLRIEKVEKEHQWSGAIFAKCGLERLKINTQNKPLDWMIPAPAQGAIVVMGKEDNPFLFENVYTLEDTTTKICTHIERQFLRTLEGGCTAPIGALATIKDNNIYFKGILLSEDGKKRCYVEDKKTVENYKLLGEHWAKHIIKNGGKHILKEL